MLLPSLRSARSLCLALVASCAGTAASVPLAGAAAVPAALAVPAGNELLFRLQAKGAQVYTCAAKETSFAWTFKAPQAELLDAAGAPAGRHFAGPTWEFAAGGQVVGEVVQKAPAPAPAADIPWLLLKARSAVRGPPGEVAFVQRLETQGGVAPASGCDAAHAGSEVQVPYAAAYAFWGRR